MLSNRFLLTYEAAIEKYINNSDNIVVVILNDQLNVVEHNNAFKRFFHNQVKLIGNNILDYLLMESNLDHPFKESPTEQPQRLIFMDQDNSTFSLECNIFRKENNYLIIGGHVMLAKNDITERMSHISSELINLTRELHKKNRALEEANAQIKVLSGFIPICAHCKQIRDDKGYWNQLEKYITEHSEAQFSHGICPDCMKELYPDFFDDIDVEKKWTK